MQKFQTLPPISLYIHLPWCVKKCPYCDFNSHAAKNTVPEEAYVRALLNDFNQQQGWIQNRALASIFFGGGTPSLFSGRAIAQILNGIQQIKSFPNDIEITLEANPGTVDESKFKDFRAAGINRLSLGVQSFQNEKLMALGRIHDQVQVISALNAIKNASFQNFNIDIMYGLPKQTIDEAMVDIDMALSFAPTHLSWYQLTIEPNTLFSHSPPQLPQDDAIWEMQMMGQQMLAKEGYSQYEVSAYAKEGYCCHHNLNYWQYGDYLGIGAGAHSKITDFDKQVIQRFAQVKHPSDYLLVSKRSLLQTEVITTNNVVFEFMLNALRLNNGISLQIFTERTGLELNAVEQKLAVAIAKGLLVINQQQICPTSLGKRFLNDLMGLFL